MKKSQKYFIKTFGCQQNVADSERIAAELQGRGMKPAKTIKTADYIVINTCMVRQSAENRVYGLVNNLSKIKSLKSKIKIIVTGCMVGVAHRDKTGKFLKRLKEIMPAVDEFMPIEEVGFDHAPLRTDGKSAWVPISNGCNNFCTFCIVPFTRGREISRPYEDIIVECYELKQKGYENITLLGMNVNSYGADLVLGEKNVQAMRDLPKIYFTTSIIARNEETKQSQGYVIPAKAGIYTNRSPIPTSLRFAGRGRSGMTAGEIAAPSARNDKAYIINGKTIKPIFVKHLGRMRIPTLFPYLLEDVAKLGFNNVNFISSNPWDFSDELIDIIARNKNISRTLHIAVQSGDDNVLRRMNRWYTSDEFYKLIKNLRSKIKSLKITTDIIVGFCGETDAEFENTVKLCKKVGFEWAYVNIYSSRPATAATKVMADDVPHAIKRNRWLILDELINRPKLKKRSNVPS
ncbi:hypothetical protein A3J15_01585 [Candidatus Roizmanbacteria bacterium RIFCSPLOWO2_02_FULL_38_10]|uniref:Uncharacterized protein n=1 Tax=Candidatus Roizmanbacteria bacterium RIFCSPLOWO2_02_FULL_38_10 TaxID=1802074 RepID=A0A1F7JN88_9BACT|nr:MAG: hypothetical protein A3J15_01585 [Candidatus Roizmanbacteria bacterium RIFCSPLOWO2_02_FULL_38_10]